MGNAKTKNRSSSFRASGYHISDDSDQLVRTASLSSEPKDLNTYRNSTFTWSKINQVYFKQQIGENLVYDVHKYKFNDDIVRTVFEMVKENIFEVAVILIESIRNFENEYPSFYSFVNNKTEPSPKCQLIDDHEHKHAMALLLLLIKIVNNLKNTEIVDNYLKLIGISHGLKGISLSDYKVMNMAILKALIIKFPQLMVDEETIGTMANFFSHLSTGIMKHVKGLDSTLIFPITDSSQDEGVLSHSRVIHRNMRSWAKLDEEIRSEMKDVYANYNKFERNHPPYYYLNVPPKTEKRSIAPPLELEEDDRNNALKCLCPCPCLTL